MSYTRGSWRGKRLITSSIWQRSASPPETEEEADLERRHKQPQEQQVEEVTKAEAPDITSVAETKVLYINGVYAPMAPANGPAANTGAARNPGSALNVSPVANTALLPPSHFETPTASTSIPEPPSLMRLQITAPVARETPAEFKKTNEDRTIALMSRGWEDFPFVPFSYKTTGTRYNDIEPVSFNPRVDPQPGKCFNCRTGEHNRRACKVGPQPFPICSYCGRKWVHIYECPRCKKAHFRYLHRQAVIKEGKEGKRPTPLWERYPSSFTAPVTENALLAPRTLWLTEDLDPLPEEIFNAAREAKSGEKAIKFLLAYYDLIEML